MKGERFPTVRFADLAHHLEEQIRGSTDRARVNRYRLAMKNGDIFPPLLVANVDGAIVLIDGFHRRDAMMALGMFEAPARITPCANLKEARWLGFDANLRHGQPLKAKLLRPAFGAFVRAGRHRTGAGQFKSYRAIAGELPGVSYSTVRRWMEADFPVVFREIGGADSDALGGLPDRGPPPTAEEELLEAVLIQIGEARALLHGVVSREARQRAVREVEKLMIDLAWDDDGAGEPDLVGF